MSSAAQNPSLDVPVTLKVFYDGATRRAKMPLREMVPRILEKHVRSFLHIPDDAKIIIERYSDSAATYVLLDSANMSVYKQLYRAAKAKSKLKLRVTLEKEDEPVPRPVSVEDEPDKVPVEKNEPTVKSEAPTPVPTAPAPPLAMTLPLRDSAPYGAPSGFIFNDPARSAESREWNKQFDSRMNDIKKTTDNLAGLATHLERRLRVPATATVPNKPKPSSPSVLKASSNLATSCPPTSCGFAICCNSCEKTIPDTHFHCSSCDDGDFDLCPSCVQQGNTCYSFDHWLIKRTMTNGQIVNSTTETIVSKPKPKEKEEPKESAPLNHNYPSNNFGPPAVTRTAIDPTSNRWACLGNMRTCNCCVQELPEREFVHCTTCEDYDLCQPCFAKDAHGHHPKHGFLSAVCGTHMPEHIRVKMAPGRNRLHHAICDGCDKYITGVRHKCLDCPDWDYCSDCVTNAHFVHPNHCFTPVYEPLPDPQSYMVAQPVHTGICCDGPLCSVSKGYPSYIRGIRYKCAVCHDLDFCANCEASPANCHNKTHPLIKFKTPIRHVSVTTTGERQDGKRMPAMGDRSSTMSKGTETLSLSEKNSMNPVRTVVDVKSVEAASPTPEPATEPKPEPEIKEEESVTAAPVKTLGEQDLQAVFVRDSVRDGTILPPNHDFEQTWALRNDGTTAWPAGCSVKFVGGDYMGHVDSAHPAGISELVSASESTVCYAPLAPGQEFSFTVLLRTPARAGRIISYWRLTTQDGFKFGHRLWCEVNVRSVATEPMPDAAVAPVEDVKEEECAKSSSTMIFPKLEKESPCASLHEGAVTETGTTVTEENPDGKAGFDDCAEWGALYTSDGCGEGWDASEDGFMTDEEYDILDASDEEYLEEQQKKLLKQ